MAKLLPLLLMLLGGAIGGGAGYFLKPADEACGPHGEASCEAAAEDDNHGDEKAEEHKNYFAMKNQFVVPVIKDGRVRSLVVLSLSLETKTDVTEMLFGREPKLRDGFLRVLFDHAHMGGFDGTFTESGRLTFLRVALLEAAQSVVDDVVTDVLITEIVRQEM